MTKLFRTLAFSLLSFPTLWAGTIQLKNGQVIHCAGPYQIEGNKLIYLNAEGVKFSLPLKIVDLKRSTPEDEPVEKKEPMIEEPKPREKSLADQIRESHPEMDFSPKENVGIDDSNAQDLLTRRGGLGSNSYEDSLKNYLSSKDIRTLDRMLSQSGLKNADYYTSRGLPTPLQTAIRSGDLKLVDLLIRHGADPSEKGLEGLSPIHTAVLYSKGNTFEMFDLLLSHGAALIQYDDETRSTFVYALEKDNESLIKYFVEKGADPNMVFFNGYRALNKMVAPGRDHLATFFLERGADPNIKGSVLPSLLMDAVAYPNQSFVELLLQRGARIERVGDKHPLEVALSQGHIGMLELLFEHGVWLGYDQKDKLLYQLIDEGRPEILPLFKKWGVDFDLPTKDGDVVLCYAARTGRLEMVKGLLALGVDDMAKGKNGVTAYSEAAGPEAEQIRALIRMRQKEGE